MICPSKSSTGPLTIRSRAVDDSGNLESVVFYKPYGEVNQHPGYANLQQGDNHIKEVMGHIMASPIWKGPGPTPH